MALADNDGDSPPLAVSDQFDRHFATDRQIRDDIGQGIVRRHILAIHPNDDVASLYPRLGGGFARYNLTDEFATILGQAQRFGQVIRHGANADAKITALYRPAFFQRYDARHGRFGRNSAAHAYWKGVGDGTSESER